MKQFKFYSHLFCF